jgi:hypothetical protein
VEASLTGYQGTGNMVLQDITGRILFQTQLVNGKTGLSLIGLARGTYVISAKTKEGKSYSTKMTVLK